MKKLFFLSAAGLGYVLGARAGRERYEQIARLTRKVKNNPTVQSTAATAADKAKETAGAAVHTVTDKIGSDKNGSDSSSKDAADKLNPDSTALQDNPYPQGDLP